MKVYKHHTLVYMTIFIGIFNSLDGGFDKVTRNMS
jgi:hypothetical protein